MPDQHPLLRLALLVMALPVVSACSDDVIAPELEDPRLFVTASAGGFHTCGITVDGRLLCWGWNYYGQVGDGTEEDRGIPTAVAGGISFGSVSAGGSHTCALTPEGVAYCWGSGSDGRLGHGSDEYRVPEPTLVSSQTPFASISAGWNHTCAVDSEGKAYCWGISDYGALGAPPTDSCWAPCSFTPVEVSGGLRFSSIAAGQNHTCGVGRNGRIYCWGSNEFGQLGASTSEMCDLEYYDESIPCSTTPVAVSGGTSWRDVGVGDYHTCALATDGRAHCWGLHLRGLLGDGVDVDDWETYRAEPAPVVGDLPFVDLSTGWNIACGVSSQGPTYCWGGGYLGTAEAGWSAVPVQVATTAHFTMVSVGGSHTCAVAPEGVMYCWGSNNRGQLGDGSHALDWALPVVVRGWQE